MPLTTAIHDSLPYIDAEPSPAERAAAEALITAELPPNSSTEPHPSLPPLPPSNFSSLILGEHERIEAKTPLDAIDKSRYESLDAPSASSDVQTWRDAVRKAYTTHTYLSGRTNNLALLEQFGKNAWLVGNSQLEDELRALERELEATKTEIDGVVIERKNAQEGVAGEVKGLEETWRRGVGRVLETEIAAEELRREILERRREDAK